MNNIVCCRPCCHYDVELIIPIIDAIYREANGTDVSGKTILLKPNILFDDDPKKAVTTHPIFLEAVILFLQGMGAKKIFVGDAPAIHGQDFTPRKSGIFDVCVKTGSEWVFFGKETVSLQLSSGKITVAGIIHAVDYIFSLPKLKTHELMNYTGAIKNTFGIVPSLNKAKQHAFHRSNKAMAKFLVDLNEAVTPDFIFMDAILAMEGPGPGNGFPFPAQLILGSTNPLALDIIASKIIGYDPLKIETNVEGLRRKKWLVSEQDIIFFPAKVEDFVLSNFKLIERISAWKMAIDIVLRRLPFFHWLQRRPVFIKSRCVGCSACVNICPVQALSVKSDNPRRIVIKDSKCIRCFCCHEVCQYNAIDIKNKFL